VGVAVGGGAVGAVWAPQGIAAAKAAIQRTIKGSPRQTDRRIARFLCELTARVYAGASPMASNGEVEGPGTAAGQAPPAHTVFSTGSAQPQAYHGPLERLLERTVLDH
jgi:hypothetical protein